MKLAVHRGMTCRAIPAPHKQHGHQGPVRDNVARGTSKGRTFRKRCRAQPECISGIRDRDLKEQLCLLRKERTFGRILRKTIELEIAKQTVKTSIRLWKMSDWTLWRSRPPPKQKKRRHTE
jgi:hypothetical protein